MNRFKPALTSDFLWMFLDVKAKSDFTQEPAHDKARMAFEIIRCYTLIEKAEEIANFYGDEDRYPYWTEHGIGVSVDKEGGHQAREFLKELEK